LDESRIAQAMLGDVTDGLAAGKHDLKADHALIASHTRFSDPARRYDACKDILQTGWSYPERLALQTLIAQKLHPLSCLKGLSDETPAKLANSDIVLVSQLLEQKPATLARRASLPQKTLRDITEQAKSTLKALERS
jgi:hypothetical protein